ncbi:hypothetical protein PN836_014700 [Ningiella sp. W23]|uniref:hypothetical protein n=1 Tax=Ningiella sp. W23 TaxID=3023715 RepID=UPI003756386B
MRALCVKRLTVIVTSAWFVVVSSMASAQVNVEELQNAYQRFALLYSKLPSGVCESKTLTSYIDALNALTHFEALMSNRNDMPDLSRPKRFLENVLADRSPCVAGGSFHCGSGPCSRPSPTYVVPEDLPPVWIESQTNLSVMPGNIKVAQVRSNQTLMFENSYDDIWFEFDHNYNRRFEFEEINKDDSSLYLYDSRRDIYLQIDLFRMMTAFRPGNGNWQDLYEITHIE